jgi:beta-trans-bergamotene synthase
MGRNTIPLLLSQPVARWSLAFLILAWTAFLISLWQPPFVASIAFAAVGLRCLRGYVSSYNEKDDLVSYCWYGVSENPSLLFQ